MTCRCHSDLLYASLYDCPKCGHRSFDLGTSWGGCERRACGYETTDGDELAHLRLDAVDAAHSRATGRLRSLFAG